MTFQVNEKKPFRWVTGWGLFAALGTGVLAFLIVLAELTVPIPGLTVLTDPREVAVLLGAATSGPVGAVLIGILAGAAVPDGNAPASMAAHVAGAVVFSIFYRLLAVRLRKSTFRFVTGWALGTLAYFYLLLMPVFLLAHNLVQTEQWPFWSTYAGIAGGAVEEAAITGFVTTLIMLILPRRYRLPLWGN